MKPTFEQQIACITGQESDPDVLWSFMREEYEDLGHVLKEGYHNLVQVHASNIETAASKLIDMDPKQYRGH